MLDSLATPHCNTCTKESKSEAHKYLWTSMYPFICAFIWCLCLYYFLIQWLFHFKAWYTINQT